MTKLIFKAIQNKDSEYCITKMMNIHSESFLCPSLRSIFNDIPWCSYISQPDKNYEEKGVTHALAGTFSQKYRAEQIPSFLAFQHCLCLPASLHHYCPAKSCYRQQSLKCRICRNYSSTPRLSYIGFLKASINLISVAHMPLYTHSSRFCCHPQPVLRPQIIWSQDTSLDEKVLPVLSCQSYSEDSTLENLQSCEN